MSSVKGLKLVYDLPNANGGFSEGDNIKGTLTFELKKDTKVKSIFIKAKGDGSVSWTKGIPGNEISYSATERFFKEKVFVTPQNSKDTVLKKGIHRHHFIVPIPQATNLPSTFKGDKGKIVYVLEAKIIRSWRMDRKVKTEFCFFSRFFSNMNQLMCSQVGMVENKVGVFSKGQVQMNATMARGAYELGETLDVVANVNNSSTKDIQPKCTLKRVVVYRVGGNQISSKKSFMKVSADVIKPNTQKIVTCSMQIPADMPPSIGNCRILSVEYFLKVHLNIKFSFDPKIKFPVVIMPPGSIAIHQSGGAMGPYPPGTMAGHQSTGLFHHPLSTFPAPYPAHYGLVNPPQPMPPYPAMPGQAAYLLPQQIYPFPVANGLPQAASMNTSQFPEPPPYAAIFPPGPPVLNKFR